MPRAAVGLQLGPGRGGVGCCWLGFCRCPLPPRSSPRCGCWLQGQRGAGLLPCCPDGYLCLERGLRRQAWGWGQLLQPLSSFSTLAPPAPRLLQPLKLPQLLQLLQLLGFSGPFSSLSSFSFSSSSASPASLAPSAPSASPAPRLLQPL